MKTAQFSGWATSRLSGGLVRKTAQFSEGDRDGHLVSVQPVYTISSINKARNVSTLCAIFEGSQSRGGYWVQLFEWPTWRLIEFLAGSAIWNDLLSASTLFWMTFDRVNGEVMVWLSKGSLVVRTSATWLSVWMSERCKCDLTNTHPHDLTMRQLKPTRHTCSTWLTDAESDKRDTCDWSLIDRDDTCATVNDTLCVSATYVFIVSITCTHEVKTLSMTRIWSQAWHWHNMQKFGWNEQTRRMQRLTWVHGVNPSVCNHQVKLSREAANLGASQNFEGWL